MKLMYLSFIICILCSCGSTKSTSTKITSIKCNSVYAFTSDYLLEGNDDFLSKIIREQITSEALGRSPMVVIDGISYIKCSKGKLKYIPTSKPKIADISVLDGKQSVPLYGEQATDGLILISTKEYMQNIKGDK